jgi:hypothetical protein
MALMMGQRMKGVKFMEHPPYEPVQNKNELGFISVSANISIDIDQEGEERQLQAKAFFDPMSWEIELVWKVVQMISDYHKDEKVAIETLQQILERLQKE